MPSAAKGYKDQWRGGVKKKADEKTGKLSASGSREKVV